MTIESDVQVLLSHARERGDLPEWIVRTEVETFVDHSGDRAIKVLLVVREDREDVVQDGDALSDVVLKVHAIVSDAGSELFPYTYFVGAAEAA